MADNNGQRSDAELGELAAFADGSLAPTAQARLAHGVEGSPELQAMVEEQRRAIAAIQTLDARAPAALRARMGTVRDGAPRRPPLRVLAFAGGLAAAVAAAAVLAVVLAGGPAAPSFGEAVAVAQGGPTGPAPPPATGDPNLLTAAVSGVAFPDYSRAFGWRAFGERADDLHGRRTATVYYRSGGREIAYTIVAGEPLAWPEGARTTRRDGIELRSLASEEGTVVTWLRDGHTCVLSGDGVPLAEALELATWVGEGSVEF